MMRCAEASLPHCEPPTPVPTATTARRRGGNCEARFEGVFSDAQKKAMIEKLTDAMVAVEGENMRQVTWVAIEDVKSGEWGIGGKALTTEAVKALAAGR